ncbi:hypothetical protein BKA63DRAFT_591290 [Paraphoma chrysanthemicola]|nr:hypothetical protein BKA63DRAFT_591290 [Paraphoma chrysanthemicola]
MKLLNLLSFSTVLATAFAGPVDAETSLDHVAKLNARGGSATGCVQAHCTMIQETTLTSKAMTYQIYWNGQKIFTLSGKPGGDLRWDGQTDFKGRKWGFKSGGSCESLAYINNFQSNYDYYQLTRTSRQSSNHDCPPCTEKANGKVNCGKCVDYEAIFSDGPSGQCYGYSGLSTCDFRITC